MILVFWLFLLELGQNQFVHHHFPLMVEGVVLQDDVLALLGQH